MKRGPDEQDKDSLLQLLLYIVLEILAIVIRKEKLTKGFKD